ncbi:MAG: radical SAM protein [Nitrospiraceae bacterium]|nr:MAG: radical SAM protein [Nitrospiraceae bacterium]
MKILFLNPPFMSEHGKFSREQRSPAVTKSGTFYYPMWLCYAAGLLEKNGFDIKIIDAPAKKMTFDEVLSLAEEFSPALTVIDTSTPSIHNDVDVAAKIKKITDGFMLLVGTHPSALPEETLKMNASVDAVARREYEFTVLELASVLHKGEVSLQALMAIDGLTFRRGNEIFHNSEREFAEDIDSLPFVSEVYRKHIDYHDYFYAHSQYPIVTLITGRGCPHHCVYCLYPQTFNGHKLRYRSIKNVVDEIEYCLKNFPDLKEIMFEDDTLTVNKKRATEFAEEILRRGLRFKWSANSRADVDLETMILLKKAGARLFCVGIESGDQSILDSMKKNLRVERIRQFFKDARQAGILIHGCFLVGNPGETKETLNTTLDFALKLNPDTAQFFPIMVYPGTNAYNWARENRYLTTEDFREWLSPEGLHNCVISRPGLSDKELVSFCDEARKKFYTRPSYIAKKLIQGLSNPQELKRLSKGAITLSKHLLKLSGGKHRQGCNY